MTESRSQIAKFAAVFAGGTMISRVLGLVREIVITALLPRPARAAFYFAFRLPNMLRDLIGEGASNAAFIPVLSETLEKEGEKAFKELVGALMSAMVILLSLITVLGLLLLPLISDFLQLIAPYTGGRQFSPEEAEEVTRITRWLFPYIFFIGLTVFQMGPLFIMRHYSTPSWGPALLNVTLVACCWLMRDWFSNPVYALVVGVWLGGIAQLAVQNRAMRKCVGVWLPNFRLRHPGIRTSLMLLVPVVLGQSAGEVNKFVDNTFAYSLGEDVQAALWVSNIIIQLPLSIFGIAISAAILPSISRAAARREYREVRETLMRGLRQCYFLIIPAVMALIVMPEPIIRLLFQRGEFHESDTVRTSVALAYLSLGLLCFAWVKVSVAGFYAVKNTKTPVKIAFGSMALNVVLILILVPLIHFRGLPLATTLAYTANFALLFVFLSRRYGRMWDRDFLLGLARITGAAVLTSLALYSVSALCHNYIGHADFARRLFHVAAPLAAGGFVYLGACYGLRVPELMTFAAVLQRRGAGSAGRGEAIADNAVDQSRNGEL